MAAAMIYCEEANKKGIVVGILSEPVPVSRAVIFSASSIFYLCVIVPLSIIKEGEVFILVDYTTIEVYTVQ